MTNLSEKNNDMPSNIYINLWPAFLEIIIDIKFILILVYGIES